MNTIFYELFQLYDSWDRNKIKIILYFSFGIKIHSRPVFLSFKIQELIQHFIFKQGRKSHHYI